jgi:hypothetical protein
VIGRKETTVSPRDRRVAGIVHLDVKPGNLIFQVDGIVVRNAARESV